MPPGEGFPFWKIAEVMAVGVGFPFEGYVHVGVMAVAVLQQAYQPFYDVDYIKGHKQQFPLLGGMYPLVVDDVFVNPRGVPRPICAKQVDAYSLGNQSAFHYHTPKTISEGILSSLHMRRPTFNVGSVLPERYSLTLDALTFRILASAF